MANIQNELPCPICGETLYSWGEMWASGIRYRPEDAGFYTKYMGANSKIPARLCNSCGNIQMFSADFVGEK